MSAGKSRPNAKGSLRRNHVDSDRTPLLGKGAQVQNSKAARVYVFGDADVAEDEISDDQEMTELRPRGKARSQQREVESLEAAEPQYLERPIADGDTLQGLALKFGVQVAEIKRINNLMQDQDFFALRVIKVPMKRYGLLSELVDEENKQKPNGAKLTLNANGIEGAHSLDANDDDSSGSEELFVRTLSIRDSLVSDQGRQAASFLQRMDKDLKSIVSSTKSQKDSLEEVVQTMTCKRIYPLQQQSSWLNGYDCGMRWWSVLLGFIVVGFVTPLLYFVYIEVNKKLGS